MQRKNLAMGFCFLVQLIFASCAYAHGHSNSPNGTGIPIPEIGHGEMAILSKYRSEIIGIASSATDTNESFRRVLNYEQIQSYSCFWGIVPGSVTDEGSPFNECAHAYLAATKSVLLAMRQMPQEAHAAAAIVSVLDAEMAQSGLSLIGCQFSGEGFNTATVIKPRWDMLLGHTVSVISIVGLLLTGLSAIVTANWLTRGKVSSKF